MFIIDEPNKQLRWKKIAACMINIEMGVDAYHVNAEGNIERKPGPHSPINLHMDGKRLLRVQHSAGMVVDFDPRRMDNSDDYKILHKRLAKLIEDNVNEESNVRCVHSSFHTRRWLSTGRNLSRSIVKIGRNENALNTRDTRAILRTRHYTYKTHITNFTWLVYFGLKETHTMKPEDLMSRTNLIIAIPSPLDRKVLESIPRTQWTITPELFGFKIKRHNMHLKVVNRPHNELDVVLMGPPESEDQTKYDSDEIPTCGTCGEEILQHSLYLSFGTYCKKKCVPKDTVDVECIMVKFSDSLKKKISQKILERAGLPTPLIFRPHDLSSHGWKTVIKFQDFFVISVKSMDVEFIEYISKILLDDPNCPKQIHIVYDIKS